MYYDDYFDDIEEFDKKIDEFKQSLINAVKQEYQEEIERLRKENSELQGIKNRMEEIEQEHKNAIIRLKNKERESDRKSLKELLDSTKLIMYKPTQKYEEKPKCEKCNDNRQIEYTSPSGKIQYESCVCGERNIVFVPSEIMRCEFRQQWRGDKLIVWYKPIEKNDDHVCIAEFGYSNVYKLYNGTTPYEEVGYYDVMFKSIEDCQKYCDWLNEKNKNGGK
jgi:hypothetical protein